MTEPVAGMTGKRWAVVAVLFSLSMLTIVDRVSISAAKPAMSQSLGLNDLMFGMVFGAFALGYALFQIPAGYFVDRFGARRVVAVVVGTWSVFTAITAIASAAPVLIAVRFLFGAAEAGAYPASAIVIRSWLPARETGFAQGMLFSGSRLGAAFGLTLVSWVIGGLGWRAPFWILGAAGIAWMLAWLVWFRDTPDESPGVSEKERAYIRAGRPQKQDPAATSWKDVFLLPETAPLMLQYFASNFTFFLCFSWLLPYLRDHYHLTLAAAGLYASIPLYCGCAAQWLSGAVVDALYRRDWRRRSRILPAAGGFLLAAAALVAAANAPTVTGAVAAFALATLAVDLTLPPSWALCIDIAGGRTGLLTGAMNMAGNIGSFVSSIAFPLLLRLTASSNTYFYCAAVINLFAALLWINMRERPRL